MALTLDDLLAREEIRDVLKQLQRGTDRLDAGMMESCFHPDAIDDHGMFRGSPKEFAATVREVLPGFRATMHFNGDANIRLEGEVAHVDTYCMTHHVGDDTDMVIALRYVDRFERRDGGWLIAKRVCAFDWYYTLPIDRKVAFTVDERWTLGQRDRTDISYAGV